MPQPVILSFPYGPKYIHSTHTDQALPTLSNEFNSLVGAYSHHSLCPRLLLVTEEPRESDSSGIQ